MGDRTMKARRFLACLRQPVADRRCSLTRGEMACLQIARVVVDDRDRIPPAMMDVNGRDVGLQELVWSPWQQFEQPHGLA